MMRCKDTSVIALWAFLTLLIPAGATTGLDPLDPGDSLLDLDSDGLLNVEEFEHGTDPENPDSDADGLPDGWEVENYLDPTDPRDAHADNDYYPNKYGDPGEMSSHYYVVSYPYDNYDEYYRPYTWEGERYFMHTDPNDSDSDSDGILDPDDRVPIGRHSDGPGSQDYIDEGAGQGQGEGGGCGGAGTGGQGVVSPKHGEPVAPLGPFHGHIAADSDGDGLPDDREILAGTGPLVPDTDGDGLTDGWEMREGTDPTRMDTDGDGARDRDEIVLQLDPNDPDTDDDGYPDGFGVPS